MARPVSSRDIEWRPVAWIPWGLLGLVSLAGGFLAALVTARLEAIPEGSTHFEFLRDRETGERQTSRWHFSPSSPDFDMFVRNGWTVVAYRRADGGSTFMVHSWGIPEVPPATADVPSWSRVSTPRSEDARCLVSLVEIAYGWPMRSMVVEVARLATTGSPNEPRFAIVGAAIPPNSRGHMTARDWFAPPWFTSGFMSDPRPVEEILASAPFFRNRPGPLFPTRMIPIGFGVNTGVFAIAIAVALLALRLGVLRTRTSIRARRGACCACGQSLAGLARCPECGAVGL